MSRLMLSREFKAERRPPAGRLNVATRVSTAPLDGPPATPEADDRRLLRRAMGLSAMGLIAFAAACIAWNGVINALKARPVVPEPFETKLAAYAASPPSYDTVIIGSSRFYHGLDPHRFDAEMARRGTPTNSFNLSFDALCFSEALFLAERCLNDPSRHLRLMIVEASLRARLAPGLERSQRVLLLHDAEGSEEIGRFILQGNHDLARKAYWLFGHAQASATRLSNVGALTNHYIRPQEPAPDLVELLGPARDGYAPLLERSEGAPEVTASMLAQLAADQQRKEQAGRARTLNDFEVSLLNDLERRAASRGVRLMLLMPPTADADIFEEFAAVTRAKHEGRIHAPTLSFADPADHPDLYVPSDFADPDHLLAAASERFTTDVTGAVARELTTAAALDRPGNH